jgi:zinc protease
MTIGLKRGLSPARTTLANGSVLLVQPTAMAPAVTIDCSFAAGSLFDPTDLPGVGQMVGRVLDRGTLRRTAGVIAEELDERGVALRVTTTRHGLSVSCTCLSEDFPAVLPILLDVARRPAFPESEIEQPRAETITALRQDDDNPAVRAVDSVAELIYGADHPYAAKPKEPRGSRADGRPDLISFPRSGSGHPAWCSPLLETGSRRCTGTRWSVEDWSAPTAEHVPVPAPPAATCRRVARVEMPGKAQADIAYGFNTIRRLDPRYYAYWMMNNVLGQFGLGGRLADNIRERQGMAYYIYSTFDPSVGEGPLLVRAGVDPVNVSRTIDAIDEEVRRLAAGPTPAEVSETCEYLVGSIPRFLETNYGIAAFLQTVERYGLGAEYDQRLPGLIRSVTIDEVRAAAAEVLNPDLAAVAVAGPLVPEFT